MVDTIDPAPKFLPVSVYTAEQCRQLDRIAIDQCGIPGIHLMKAAGRAAFNLLCSHWQSLFPVMGNQGVAGNQKATGNQITVFCGGGNNAGDGYVIAGLARQNNISVVVCQIGDPKTLKGDAGLAYRFALGNGVKVVPFNEQTSIEPGVVVDALLGTGAQGEVRADHRAAIELINRSQQPVLAIDVPSGLCANTGRQLGAVICANATITFIGLKRGLITGVGPAAAGRLYFDDLQVPQEAYEQVPSKCRRLQLRPCLAALPTRAANAHKGNFGHVLVIGGDNGMAGAVAMAAEAAARVGSGLVSVATRAANVGSILVRRPEIMAKGIEDVAQLQAMLERATVVVLGPGLGQSEWSRRLFSTALAAKLPMVVDADGLNLLALGATSTDHNWILTPHPGEAARLLGCSTGVINDDRFAAVENLLTRYGGVAVLKGAGSIVASTDAASVMSLSLSDTGNPGMASGGMGDVLSGVLGGLLAQGMSLKAAAELGVSLHGAAADKAVEHSGERGLLATDLVPHLRRLVNGLF